MVHVKTVATTGTAKFGAHHGNPTALVNVRPNALLTMAIAMEVLTMAAKLRLQQRPIVVAVTLSATLNMPMDFAIAVLRPHPIA